MCKRRQIVERNDFTFYGYFISWWDCTFGDKDKGNIDKPHTYTFQFRDAAENDYGTESITLKFRKNGYVIGYFDAI